jgi:WD40 repeat protein
VATGGEDKLVKLWNTKERKELAILKNKYVISNVAFSMDGSLFMSCSNDNKVSMYSLTGKSVK